MLEKIKKEMGFEFMDLEPLFYEAVLSLEFVPNPYGIVRVLSALDMKNICTWADRWIEDIEEFAVFSKNYLQQPTGKELPQYGSKEKTI